MSNQDEVARKLDELARKAAELQHRAQRSCDDGDTLWMSSLDIIGELLNAITGLIKTRDIEMTEVQQMSLHCPHCRTFVTLSPEAAAETCAKCPSCGKSILLANPT